MFKYLLTLPINILLLGIKFSKISANLYLLDIKIYLLIAYYMSAISILLIYILY